jgi:hypothetical protein
MRYQNMWAVLFCAVRLAIVGCEQKGPAERAGKQIGRQGAAQSPTTPKARDGH